MIRILSLVLLSTLLSFAAQAQLKKHLYNFNNWGVDTTMVDKFNYNLDVPTVLIATGTVANLADNHFYNIKKTYTPDFDYSFDDYIQYAPAVVMLGLKLGGVEGRSTWSEMLVADAFGMAMVAGAVQGVKYTVGKNRPDNSSRNSFPSGHTATAFMTATMLHKEYGHHSHWISAGAYTCAALTGLARQLNNRHWMSDVLAGAGIGIICVELGYLFSDLIFSDKYSRAKYFNPPSTRYDAPSFLSFNMGLKNHINNYRLVDNSLLDISYGGSVAVEGAWYMNTYWGMGAKLDVSSYAYTIDGEVMDDAFGLLSTNIGIYNSIPVASCLRFENKALLGYSFIECGSSERLSLEDNLNFTIGTSFVYWAKSNFSLKAFGDYKMMPNFINGKTANELSAGMAVSYMF